MNTHRRFDRALKAVEAAYQSVMPAAEWDQRADTYTAGYAQLEDLKCAAERSDDPKVRAAASEAHTQLAAGLRGLKLSILQAHRDAAGHALPWLELSGIHLTVGDALVTCHIVGPGFAEPVEASVDYNGYPRRYAESMTGWATALTYAVWDTPALARLAAA